jgi:AraC-like DNA-binding protein
MMAVRDDASQPTNTIAVHTPREVLRASVRAAFPRRRTRLAFVRTAQELDAVFRRELVDAVIIDATHPGDDTWTAVALAREFPSAPFFAVSAYRAPDAPAIARCIESDCADVLAEDVDDAAMRDLVMTRSFGARFAAALDVPPASLRLTSAIQQATWNALVSYAGRTVRTEILARSLGLTREHLSRRFATDGAPNLKRVADLVRLIAAAELAKNPGYDTGDVAAVLHFASASHLATTTQRVIGVRPSSLSRLRAVDLIKRFAAGRARSRRVED